MKTPCRLLSLAAALAVLGACSAEGENVSGAPPSRAVSTVVQTEKAARGVEAAVLAVGAGGAADSRIVGAVALGGLEVYALDGRKVGHVDAGEAVALDVAYDVPLADGSATVVAAIDIQGHRLRLFRLDGDALAEIGARDLPLGFAAEGVCLLRSRFDGALHAFVVGDGGEVDHQLLFAAEAGGLDARQVRRVSLPSPLQRCVADPVAMTVYVSEEAVGIWRFNADPEADLGAVLVDSPRFGSLEDVGGLAIHDGGPGARWLLAADEGRGVINLYDIERDEAFLGGFSVAGIGDGVVGEPGALSATSMALGERFPAGGLLVADEDASNFKLLSTADLASVFRLPAGAAQDPRVRPEATLATVTALYETAPVGSYGDAADDPAIWAHPTQPEKSLIVATDKKAGLYVYDMQGRVKQFLPDGKMNNVDLREGFRLGAADVVLVTASNRSNQSIAIYRLETERGELVAIADGVQPTGLLDPYGLCMYRSARNGDVYVFVNGDETEMRQWRLRDAGGGRVRTEHVRDLAFDSQTEGCVADDSSGQLYVGEEDVALWRLPAEPDGGDEKVAVDRVDANPAIADDIEGVGIYHLGDGRGYIVASSQGNDTFAVYRLEDGQEYLGSFAVVADPARGIDGVSETDGLEVSSRNLGPGLEHGAMVAQDGRNVLPAENQNYKIVPWKAIADALGLEVARH